MANKHSINTFSTRVDDLLAGKTAPTDDSLLSLASQMLIGPALEPTLAFAQRLRSNCCPRRQRVRPAARCAGH